MGQDIYTTAGVGYGHLDPAKVQAQTAAGATSGNAKHHNMQEVSESRGESAYVYLNESSGQYHAFVVEGLGTKAIIADRFCSISGRSHYDSIAQDTVAMIVNDLITVGAMPTVISAYWSVGSSEWFADGARAHDLINGWRTACDEAGAVWAGGETPALKELLRPDVIELAGAAAGVIADKRNLTLASGLQGDEDILMVHSSGIHANGLTVARKIADALPDGYATKMGDGRLYGEALLTPTPLYVSAVRELFEAGVDVRYMANITGHGWRKIMRAPQPFTYTIHTLPAPQAEFAFMQEQLQCDDREMYGTFNMGAGFAIMVNPDDTEKALRALAQAKHQAATIGTVRPGKKQVILEPNGVRFAGDTLNIR